MKMSSKPFRAKVSASPMVAVVMPTAPASSCSFAISTHLWVFTCGRSATPAAAARSATWRMLRRRRARSTLEVRRRRLGHDVKLPGRHPPASWLRSSAWPAHASSPPSWRRCSRSACRPGVGARSRTRSLPRSSSSARRPATHLPRPTRPPRRQQSTEEPEVLASDGRPRRASLTIPRLGLRGLDVVPYVGRTDDAPGTVIQNRGRPPARTDRRAASDRAEWATTR